MPRSRNKQRWDNLNPGFQRNSRNDNGYQNNWNQNNYDNYGNPYFQGDMNNPNANSWCDMGQNYNNPRYLNDHYNNQNYQRNFIRNNDNCSNFGVGGNKKDFNSNRGKFNRNANNKFPECQTNIPQYTKFDKHNVQDDLHFQKNTTQNSCNLNIPTHSRQNFSDRSAPKTENPWYVKNVNPQINGIPKPFYKNYTRSRFSFVESYDRETKVYNEKGYITRESLYRDQSLVNDNNSNKDRPNLKNEQSPEDWTDKFWRKHVNTGAPKPSGSPYTSVTVSRKNQNSVEKTLNKMLAKPVEMDKGKSLLLKMGWQGGGLGRDGDGILEPITPNSTYAVNTIGLGLLTVKPEPEPQPELKKKKPFAALTKKKLNKPEFQDIFYTNLLQHILEFVKNDTENKIIFEPRLMKKERMNIHLLVEKIRESDNWEDFQCLQGVMDKHFDLVKDIWVYNCYELWTESEGERMERRICLYKEAPAHIYLVTPEDLTEDDNKTDFDDTNEFDDDESDRVNKMDLNDENEAYFDDEDDVDSDNSVDVKQEKHNIFNRERKAAVDIKQSVVKNDMEGMEEYEQKIFKEENNTSESPSEYNNCEMNDETQNATNYQELKQQNMDIKQSVVKNDPNMEVNDQKIFKKENNNSVSPSEFNSCEMNDETQNATTYEELKQQTMDIKQSVVKNEPNMEVNDQKIFKKENNTSDSPTEYNNCEMNDETQNATNYEELKQQTMDIKQSVVKNEPNMEVNDQKIFKKENNTSDSPTEYNIRDVSFCDDIKDEIGGNVDVKQEKDSTLGKIAKYFKEFCADEIFKEFRFLGPFSDEEIDDINVFFDVCMKLDDNEREENIEVAKSFQENMLDVLEDNNGKRFIKKIGKNQSSSEAEAV